MLATSLVSSRWGTRFGARFLVANKPLPEAKAGVVHSILVEPNLASSHLGLGLSRVGGRPYAQVLTTPHSSRPRVPLLRLKLVLLSTSRAAAAIECIRW